jgi:hypothetical protein
MLSQFFWCVRVCREGGEHPRGVYTRHGTERLSALQEGWRSSEMSQGQTAWSLCAPDRPTLWGGVRFDADRRGVRCRRVPVDPDDQVLRPKH